jgi:hypothetical protein
MADAKLLARANRVLHRLDVLDDAMANVDAFCALQKDLNARDQSIVKFPHSAAIHMVRAGILRAAIGTIMACLDPEDWRGNRASIGQILGTLKDTELVDLFAGSEATVGRQLQWPFDRRERRTTILSRAPCLGAESGCGTTRLHIPRSRIPHRLLFPMRTSTNSATLSRGS